MPYHKDPNYVAASPWESKPKQIARELTIVDSYKKVFGQKIPKDKQYWTMCGAHFDKDELPLSGEFGQVVNKNLIDSSQFYGVDQEESIINKNRKLFPDTKWMHGDFVDTMLSHSLSGNFNPAIINYDGVLQPVYGSRYLKKIMKLLDWNFDKEVLLVANFVLKNPYRNDDKLSFSVNDTIKELAKIYFFPDHWSIIPEAYVYSGHSTKSNSQMGVVMFIKQKHDINNIQITPNRRLGKGDKHGWSHI